MKIGILGLGKMGLNISRRLMKGGHSTVVFDLDHHVVETAVKEGAIGVEGLHGFARNLESPRTVWSMLPSGRPTDQAIHDLSLVMEPGDVVIDGGNSNYKMSMARAQNLQEKGIHFLDVGTSGGIWGLEEGYCMMIGGEDEVVQRLKPIFETLAPSPKTGWVHVGPNGAGHFAKMVHNGIEYGMMQALAEGFEIMHAKKELVQDVGAVAEAWREGSVIRSWLLDLAAAGFAEDPELVTLKGYVEDSGEGRWTVQEAIDLGVPANVITNALFARFASRDENAYGNRVLALLRHKFGGHAIKPPDAD